jgi:hypothetical protein
VKRSLLEGGFKESGLDFDLIDLFTVSIVKR